MGKLKSSIFNIFHIHHIKGLQNYLKGKEWLYWSWGKILNGFWQHSGYDDMGFI